jgi:hypothetical protein
MKLLAALALTLTFASCGGERTIRRCYEYSCSTAGTGEKCFDSMGDYCDSVCGESDTCAQDDCMQNCS